jgi:hypothetical protein
MLPPAKWKTQIPVTLSCERRCRSVRSNTRNWARFTWAVVTKRVQADIADLEAELAAESAALSAQYDPRNLELETISVAPLKKNIHVTATGIVWLPA